MAIDRGPWNALVDDDGSNLVGTIWNKDAIKTVLLDPIDGLTAGMVAPEYGAFNLHDASGAALGVLGTAVFAKIGRLVAIQGQPAYPATASGLSAKVGGFPWANGSLRPSGFYLGYGPSNVWHFGLNAVEVLILAPGTMAARTNAEMSGSNNVIIGFYVTD